MVYRVVFRSLCRVSPPPVKNFLRFFAAPRFRGIESSVLLPPKDLLLFKGERIEYILNCTYKGDVRKPCNSCLLTPFSFPCAASSHDKPFCLFRDIPDIFPPSSCHSFLSSRCCFSFSFCRGSVASGISKAEDTSPFPLDVSFLRKQELPCPRWFAKHSQPPDGGRIPFSPPR